MARSEMTMVRTAERVEVALPGRLSVAPMHRTMVRLRGDRDGQTRWSDIDIVDLSEGGLGLMSQSFLPRGTRVEIRLDGLGETEGMTLLALEGTVKQCRMTDGRPAYFVGCSLRTDSDRTNREQRARVTELLRSVSAGEPITRATVERLDAAANAAVAEATHTGAAGGAAHA